MTLSAFHAALEVQAVTLTADIAPGMSVWLKTPAGLVRGVVASITGPAQPTTYMEAMQRRAAVNVKGRRFYWPTIDLVRA